MIGTKSTSYCGAKTIVYVMRPGIVVVYSNGTVKWNTVSGAGGYQIQYSTSSSFSNAKTLTSASGTSSKVLSVLVSGKKYYIRVRVYKTVDSVKYYSAWSAVKSVTTFSGV